MNVPRSVVSAGMIAAAMLLSTGVAAAMAQGNGGTDAMSKGGNPRTATVPSVTLDQSDPHLGSTVTFTVTAPASVKAPRVSVMCSQGTALVYGEAGTFDHAFLLGGASSVWLQVGGTAECAVDLFYWDYVGQQQVYVWLASTSFTAGG